jgi:hypothetical protein
MYLNTYMQITSIQTITEDPHTHKKSIETITYVYTIYDKNARTHTGPAAHSIDILA